MASESTNYQCPSCGGRLHFEAQTNNLACDFCGSRFRPEDVEAYYSRKEGPAAAEAPSAAEASVDPGHAVETERVEAGEDPIQAYLKRSRWDDKDAESMRAYNCSSCGAQLMVDQVTAIKQCPYCGNETIVPGQLADALRPDYLIPFKKTKEDAIAALKEYYRDKKLLPKSFSDENHLNEIQGVYVPFWLYSTTANADANFSMTQVMTWSDSENLYTKTDHYAAERKGSIDFARVPVDGSTRMPDAHMDSIEPYDYSEMVPFSLGYLPGFLADRYDQNAEECKARAEERMGQSAQDALSHTVEGYDTVSLDGCSSSVEWNDIRYALLPVWMLHTRWNGQDFLFAMNGQTGKLIGDLPISWKRLAVRFLAAFVPIAAVAFAVLRFAPL